MNPNVTRNETPREDDVQTEQVAPASLSLKQAEAAESLTSVDSLACYGIILCE